MMTTTMMMMMLITMMMMMMMRLGKKSVAMSYDFEWWPQGVDEMSVAMPYDIATLKEVVRPTSLKTSLPSLTDIAMSLRII
eukprot:12091190-Karenia_brevis.AAC.1